MLCEMARRWLSKKLQPLSVKTEYEVEQSEGGVRWNPKDSPPLAGGRGRRGRPTPPAGGRNARLIPLIPFGLRVS